MVLVAAAAIMALGKGRHLLIQTNECHTPPPPCCRTEL